MLINFSEHKMWGYYNSETNQTIPAQFYGAADFKDGYAIVRKESSSFYGVIDETGNEILPFLYSSISYEGDHTFKIGSNKFNCLYNQFGKIIDEQGNEISSFLQIYKTVQYLDTDLYHVLDQDDKEGIVYRGELVILFEGKQEIISVQKGLIVVGNISGPRWLYDYMGNKILPEYKDFKLVNDKYIIVDTGEIYKGYGIFDVGIKNVVEAKYSKIEYIGDDTFCLSYQKDYKEEIRTVTINAQDKSFIFSQNNSQIQLPINSDIDWCKYISEDFFIVSSKYKYGIANSKGDIIVKCEYDQYKECNSAHNIIFEKEGKKYLINLITGACSTGYRSIEPLSPKYFKVCEIDCIVYGVINSNFEIVIPLQYNDTLSYIDDKFSITCFDKKYIITEQAQIILDNGTVLSPEITSVEPFSDGFAKVKNNKNLIGFIDEEGKIVIPCKFVGNVSDFQNGVAFVSVFTRTPQSHWRETREWKSSINKKGDFIVKYQDDTIELCTDCQLILDFDSEVTRAYKNGKWGLIDINCSPVTQYEYDEIIPLCDGFYKVRQEELWGVVSSTGNTIIQCKYKTISNYDKDTFQIVFGYNQRKVAEQLFIKHDGNIVVNYGDKQVIIPANWDYVYDYDGNYSIVKKNGKYGIIDLDVKVVIDCHCDSINSIYNGHTHVTIGNKDYLLSLFNNDSIELPKCSYARYYSQNFIVVGDAYHNSGSFEVIDREGRTISKRIYNEISVLENDCAIVKVNHYPHPMFGVISFNGTEIIPTVYYSLHYIQEQNSFLANSEIIQDVQTNPHYINTSGNPVIINANSTILLPSKFLCGRKISCGLAAVAEEYKTIEYSRNMNNIVGDSLLNHIEKKKDGIETNVVIKTRYGFIDHNCVERITCKYDYVTDFKNCFSIVTLNKKKGVINTKGEIIIAITYDDIEFLTDTLFKVKQKDLWGVVSVSGEIIIPFSYLAIGGLSENLIAVNIPIETDDILVATPFGRIDLPPFTYRIKPQRLRKRIPKRYGKWGFINMNNDVIVDCKYSEVRNFSEGLAAVKESTWNYIDAQSNIVFSLPASVTNVTDFCNGMAKVSFSYDKRVQEHVILSSGHLLIDNVEIIVDLNTITFIEGFQEGFVKVLYGSKWGLINENGETVIEGLSSEPTSITNGISTFVDNGGNKRIINSHGEFLVQSGESFIVLPSEYISAVDLGNDLYSVERKSDHLYGVTDSNFNVIIPFSYNRSFITITVGKNVFLKVGGSGSKYSIYYNIYGQRVIPFPEGGTKINSEYSITSDGFCCNLAAVSNKDDLWGFVNLDGVEEIPCIYDSVSNFENGYCIVCKDFKTGVIDTSGNNVINLGNFEEIEETGNGVWTVIHSYYGHNLYYQIPANDGYDEDEVTRQKWIPDDRIINNRNEILLPLYGTTVSIPSEYEWTDDAFHEGFLSVCQNGKWGIINTRLELVVNCIYDKKFAFDNGIAIAHIENITYVIDTSGNVLFSGKYNNVNRYQEHSIFICQLDNKDEFDVYDILGNYKFSTSYVKSQIQILNSQNLSSNCFSLLGIIPISNKYLKFSVLSYYNKKRITSWGVCDITGCIIVNAIFDEIGGIGSGLLSVAKIIKEPSYFPALKWGYANLKGKVVIEYQYSRALPFINGLAKISKGNNQWGLLTTNGLELTNCIYDEIEYTSNHEVIVSDKWDKTKKNTITEKGLIHFQYFERGGENERNIYINGYDWCSQIYMEHCIVQKNKSYGIINKTGFVTFPLSEMGDVVIAADSRNRICFKKNNEYKHITFDGRIHSRKGDSFFDLPVGIHWCKEWNEDLIEVESNGKWGLLNSNLEIVIEIKYDLVQYISNNIALCKSTEDDQDIFYLNNFITGEIIKLPYYHCSEFENGCAIVSIITKKNKSSWNNKTDNELAYGLIDYRGNELLPCKYSMIQFRKPPIVEHSSIYVDYEEPYSREDSLMDALDGCEDAYWNID